MMTPSEVDESRELRGIELSGSAEFVGETPRIGEACTELEALEAMFARKNLGLEATPHDGRHAWIRLTPAKTVSWDFRKL